MATHHNSRPSSSKRPLSAHIRSSKLAPLSKRANANGASRKAAYQSWDEPEDEYAMATSFLQYCTTCEKQLIVPSNSVLYCSEKCRKMDDNKELAGYSPSLAPFTNLPLDDIQFRDIVAPRSPTAPPSKRSSCAFSEFSSDDNAASGDEKGKVESEASKYLRQFQSSATIQSTARSTRRPRYNRASTSQAIFSVAPSLSHTPASSVSFSLPYTPSTTRPLPPRTNPSSSSFASKSADLVTPFTNATAPSTPLHGSLKTAPISTTSTGNAEGEFLYEKTPVPSVSSTNGSLRQLFAGTPRWT